MLIKCPECELQVSDKAIVCPHCGYPLKKETPVPYHRRSNKRRRLPNGFGQISEIKHRNLRKPFRAMVTVGKTETGRPICKPLKPESYFKTYNEAYEALVEYNKNPYDVNPGITMTALYEKYKEDRLESTSDNYKRSVQSAWYYCSSIYNMRVIDVRARHIKGCIDDGYRIETRGEKKGKKIYASASTKERIKSLFNVLLDYAVEFDITNINYARTFELSGSVMKEIKENKNSHIPFAEEEMETLWDNVGKVKYVNWILIQCYMGWRPQELATLKLNEVNLDEWYMKAGMKTEAGKQRIVPIHSRIRDLVSANYKSAMDLGSEYLFNDFGKTHSNSMKMTYDKYKNRFNKVIVQLGLNPDHKPHDPRNTFITRGKKAGMDEYALKEMVGHSVQDITESVYTLRDLEWLREDVEKLR